MAAPRSEIDLAPMAQFIERLYELGGYTTWRQFAEEAKLSVPQISHFKNGKVEPHGINLLKLIQAVALRTGEDAGRTAVRALPDVLGDIETALGKVLLGQAEIGAHLGIPASEPAAQKPAARTQKASSRRR